MIPEQTVDTADVARFLLLSPQRVRQLAAEGVLEKATDQGGEPLRGRFNLLATVNSYIRYLRSKLAGRVGTTDEYTQARARRMSALADIEQLRLKRIHRKTASRRGCGVLFDADDHVLPSTAPGAALALLPLIAS